MLSHRYFEWLTNEVSINRNRLRILNLLYETEYIPEYDMDTDRLSDGISLRESYCEETDVDIRELEDELQRGCTVLEMLIALCARIEEITLDSDLYLRIGRWFWRCVDTLGLTEEAEYYATDEELEDILERFHRHEYEPDGTGGVFKVSGGIDMRELSLWEQAQEFLKREVYGL